MSGKGGRLKIDTFAEVEAPKSRLAAHFYISIPGGTDAPWALGASSATTSLLLGGIHDDHHRQLPEARGAGNVALMLVTDGDKLCYDPTGRPAAASERFARRFWASQSSRARKPMGMLPGRYLCTQRRHLRFPGFILTLSIPSTIGFSEFCRGTLMDVDIAE
ncbi:hypothetical protein BOTBODRAFT_144640 [Botryobasidium botryosum FD-172 SS1]|uniref:Uncharacterized protein n=1 Tax=Botryobasidium botryosum (strain FD-172 SS1) TaxID=930990 RepID=A0A067MKW2_BOTB1|nr:hypothetical protein BOTBODRAFT_144640 [Botryobasidium botryosum FD-172 SS1]